MIPRLTLVTAPAAEPVSFADMQTHLRLDATDEQTYLESLVTAARSMIEEQTGRSMITTVWRAHWDALPRVGRYAGAALSRELLLPRAPLVSVASLTYLDEDGATQTVSASDYTVEPSTDPRHYGRLRLVAAADWPVLGDFPGALRCQFSAGYGSAASDVPAELRAAVRLLAAHLFEQRLPLNIGNIVNELPFSLRALIDLHQLPHID